MGGRLGARVVREVLARVRGVLGKGVELGGGMDREGPGFEGDRAGGIWEKGGGYQQPFGAELVGVRANDT